MLWLMKMRLLLVLTFASCSVFAATPAPAPTSNVKAGFAERDITPPLGSEVPGGYGKSFARTFHDPCKVRVAVFDDGKKRVALVGTDTLIIPRKVVLDAREQIVKLCGIPADCVMIGASH